MDRILVTGGAGFIGSRCHASSNHPRSSRFRSSRTTRRPGIGVVSTVGDATPHMPFAAYADSVAALCGPHQSR